jgi:predicted acetyltransferase
MLTDDIKLIDPSEDLRDEYLEYMEEFRAADEPFVHDQREEAMRDFASFVQLLRDRAEGRNLPEGHVPSNTYWLVRGRRILATSRLRHRLTAALENDGGHIGYEVRPSERTKGYGKLLLSLTLERARQRGLKRVLLTCNQDNPASARIIETGGGKLTSEGVSKRDGKPIRRYWIELTEEGRGQ